VPPHEAPRTQLKDEILAQMSGIHEWRGRFVVPIPEVKVLD